MKFAPVVLALLLGGCFGRLPGDTGGQTLDVTAYGLEKNKPALIAFGAVWCKPCVSEIPALNRARTEFSSHLQIVSYLVEGPQKGAVASGGDSDLFRSPAGEKPAYPLKLDAGWTRFESLSPPSGRALPTMVFITRDGQIARIVQRSLEYETELLPALHALVAGAEVPPDPKPAPEEPPAPPKTGQPTPPPGKRKSVKFDEWSATNPVELANVEAAWRHGLEDFTFPDDEMPFAEMRLTVMAFEDGRMQPLQAVWLAHATGCKLTVWFNEDGSYKKSEGICR